MKFDWTQQQEIDLGKEAGVDVSVYAKEEFIAAQMHEIRLGLQAHLDVSCYARPEFDWFQMEEIRKGLLQQVDITQYANPSYGYKVMHEIRLSLAYGMDLFPYVKEGYSGEDLRQIRKAMSMDIDLEPYLNAGYREEQLEEIRKCIMQEIDIDSWLKPGLTGNQIREIRLGLQEGMPVNSYAAIEYGWQQMREIRMGLEERLDVSLYAKEVFNHLQMAEIRQGLESRLDVSGYARPNYSETKMKEMRLALLNRENEEVQQDMAAPASMTLEHMRIEVSLEKMEAAITLDKPDRDMEYRTEQIVDMLMEQGIVFGIRRDKIEKLLRNGDYNQRVVVVSGIPAIDGEDGVNELLFRTDLPRLPKPLPDGSVDYINIDVFERVEKGQTIAVYHPPTTGQVGMNIYGEDAVPREGNSCPALVGEGFQLLEDGVTYVAKESGKIEYKDGKIIVSPLIEFPGSVTAVTGRVVFDGCVHVCGSVGSKGYIEASGDIIIDGNVGTCTLVSGADIMIRRGVSTKKGCSIRAQGKVMGSFFEGANVFAKAGVEANYLLNSTVDTEGKVDISGNKGVVVGGSTSAVKGLEARNIGNSSGIDTVIDIGTNDKIMERKRKLETAMRKCQEQIDIFQESMTRYERRNPNKNPENEGNCRKVWLAIEMKQEEIKHLQEQWEQLQDLVEENENVALKVQGTAYAGSIISINQAKCRLMEDVPRVSFRKKDGRIMMAKYY